MTLSYRAHQYKTVQNKLISTKQTKKYGTSNGGESRISFYNKLFLNSYDLKLKGALTQLQDILEEIQKISHAKRNSYKLIQIFSITINKENKQTFPPIF